MHDPISRAETYLENVGMLDEPGAVLYSSAETLRPGPIYLLGLNPGGSERTTLRDSISKSRAGCNAYLDERFAPGGHLRCAGQATLQRRVQGLCNLMGLDTRNVPASNLVFVRSTRLKNYPNFDAARALCFPVHQIFLEAIKPKFLMTFGALKSFGSLDSSWADFRLVASESRCVQHGRWKAHRGRVLIASTEIAFGNIPHMSVWASDQRQEVVRWAIAGLV